MSEWKQHCEHDSLVIDEKSYEVAQAIDADTAAQIVREHNQCERFEKVVATLIAALEELQTH